MKLTKGHWIFIAIAAAAAIYYYYQVYLPAQTAATPASSSFVGTGRRSFAGANYHKK